MEVDGKRRAIVTGHSRGLGEALAAELMNRGFAVLGVARGTNAELASKYADALSQRQLDLSDAGALSGWLSTDELRRAFAGADTAILVNNAGVLQPVGPLEHQEPAAVGRAVVINAAAPLALSAAFAAATGSIRDRRILHVSSGAGRNAYAGWSVYCATKAALDQHARAVSLDGTTGLRICSLAPGVIDTDMQAEVRSSREDHFPRRERFVKLKREGGLAPPAQVAVAVVDLLLSPAFGTDPVADLR